MSWLVGTTLASMVAGFVVVRIFDYIFSGVAGNLVNAARAGVFAGAWTATTAGSGMRAFSERIRLLRRGSRDASKRIDPKGKRR